eukprot:TRINITY_DN26965_c0_g1_i1.p1 TRINITY_DN26965_c0_g1~~TRINITY_DN26965_c0_g1_i1.p1  ORF type:complete len:787 (-),score=104.81 TRINITY_DN26965_c0_g1_i1:32-2392(-)
MRLFAFKDAVRASCRLSADFFPVHIADIPVLQQAGRRGQAESIPSAVEKFDPAQISSLSSKELKQFVVSHGWSVSAGGDIVLSGKGRTHSVLQQEVLAKIAAENKKAQTAGPAITVSDAGDVFATSADLTDWSCDGWSPTRLSEVRALEISSKLAAQVLQHQAQHLQRPSRTTRWANFDVELVPRVAFQGQVIALEPCVGIMLSHTARAPPELNLAEICGSFGSKIVGLQVRSVTRGRENRGEIAGYAGRLGEGQLRDKLLSLTSCAEVRETIASSPDDEPCWQVRLGKAGKVFTFLGSKLQPCLTPKNMERLDRMLGCNASAQIGRDSILPPRERQELIDAELERLNSSAPEVTKKLFAPSPRRVADPGQCAENFVSFDEPGFLVGEGRAISSVNGGALWSSLQRHGLYLYGGIGRTLCMRGYILGSSSQKDFDRSCASFHSIAQLFKQLHIEVDGSPSHVTRVASVAEALSHAEMEGAQAAVFFSRTNACYHAAKEACLQARPPGLQHLASQWIDLARPSHQAPALKNIVLQLCAKLGHTPYILQGRPEGASGGGGDDLICGMDVCHMHNPQSGEMSHVMGGIQLQQASGEVLDSWLCKGKIHGESIPDSVWEKALTKEVCSGRKVIVHRDGRFTNSEKEFLARHAASIGAAGPIGLVEIVKHAGGTPRMYTGSDNAPSGSCLIFSETECILTSGSCKSTGTRNPLLIRLVGGSTPTLSIKSVAEDIFRLSFVSYGSLYSIPRLPVSTKTADLTAYVHASLSTQALGNEANSILVSQGKQQYWL